MNYLPRRDVRLRLFAYTELFRLLSLRGIACLSLEKGDRHLALSALIAA